VPTVAVFRRAALRGRPGLGVHLDPVLFLERFNLLAPWLCTLVHYTGVLLCERPDRAPAPSLTVSVVFPFAREFQNASRAFSNAAARPACDTRCHNLVQASSTLNGRILQDVREYSRRHGPPGPLARSRRVLKGLPNVTAATELGSTVVVSSMRAFIMPTQGGSKQYNIRSGIRIIPPLLRAQGLGCMDVAPWPCRTQVADAGSVLYNIRFSGPHTWLLGQVCPTLLDSTPPQFCSSQSSRHYLFPSSRFGRREEQQGRLLVDSAACDVAQPRRLHKGRIPSGGVLARARLVRV